MIKINNPEATPGLTGLRDRMNWKKWLDTAPTYRELINYIQNDDKIYLNNVKSGIKAPLAAYVREQTNRTVLLVAATEKDAKTQYRLLAKKYKDSVLYLPAESLEDYYSEAHNPESSHQRVHTLWQLANQQTPLLVVAPVSALLKRLLPLDTFKKTAQHLSIGKCIDLESFTFDLTEMGYERTHMVESPGQYAVRGGILDVFSVGSPYPVRIELFDDEIDLMRCFDASNQRSIREIEKTVLLPAKEIIIPQARRDKHISYLQKKYSGEIYSQLLEAIERNPGAWDELLFAMEKDRCHLFHYLQHPVVIWADYAKIVAEQKNFDQSQRETSQRLIDGGMLFKEAKNKFIPLVTLEKDASPRGELKTYLFNTKVQNQTILDLNTTEVEDFLGKPDYFEKFIQQSVAEGNRILIFHSEQSSADHFMRFFKDRDFTGFGHVSEPGVYFQIGDLEESFALPGERIVFLKDSDVFKTAKTKQKRRKRKGKAIDSFTDLKVGDYVVHDIHGIGVYRGIEKMEIDGVNKDLLVIEYAEQARLYIAIEQMNAIQTYIGTGGERKPKINRLGHPDWSKAKQRAKKAVEDMADDLIALYAERRNRKGFAFSEDTPWQKEFEDRFPFEETEDQLRSIEEIKKDMEAPVPMDRLLCGDVGYGKTEVALRAAFKAIMDGKQVAFLVPTTILASQHYATVKERFANYPIGVEVLSRYNSPGEQKRIIEDLSTGQIDLLVGTHRMLSKDVRFKNLGLLIIDEEQRFGVKDKEHLKQLKTEVDVLTLSATPIPRTLHMSLSGVRDMSILNDPPEGRQPVKTYVMPYNPITIKENIEKELSRGGQVFYVHNRVYDLDETLADVATLVPHAKIEMAHGRMSSSEMEKTMKNFIEGKTDILVSTTIVESGIDIGNVNTMIIDQGDRFGLSQLYQLRGRIGRSPRQAYCYITYRRQQLTEIAEKRLKAIKDFTAFGSGFKIAMRDMEIRGAGNLLGGEQSGHLFRIGYEMYTRLLEETIQEKTTGVRQQEVTPTQIHVQVDNYIPEYYIDNEEMKYDIYKRIAYIQTQEDFRDMQEELEDRFGLLPKGVMNLMYLAIINNSATALGIQEITQRGKDFYLTFGHKKPPVLKSETITALYQDYRLKLKADKEDRPRWRMQITETDHKAILKALIQFLNVLKEEKSQ
ncbi:MAG: transcription-repair coupling factor [Eubacteriaceae bacterium]|jgi:transcription-repair coupling factor (superfamily II helicase)|nr:transcription-repair coupling factor [Eubacteriaceae bacterium]